MPAQSDTESSEFLGWTLRVRPARSAPSRLLVLLHGWTGDEDSMWIFVRGFAPGYWIVAPRVPHIARPAGFSWRPLPREQGTPPSLADLRPSAEALIGLVDAYSVAVHLDAGPFDAIGFSQGAVMVGTLGLLFPTRIRRAAMLAGFIPAGAEALVAGRPLEGKPVFVAHGTMDELVPLESAHQSIELLHRAGASVTFCEDEVGHRLSAGCLRALQAFFA